MFLQFLEALGFKMSYNLHMSEAKSYEQKKYCVTITYKCNWHCEYCITDTHSQKEPTLEEIDAKIDQIADGSEVDLSGGEPGAISRDRLEHIVARLEKKNCSICVNTNGLFFKRYPDYVGRISQFFYHCSENLDKNIPITFPETDAEIDIDYALVVTDDNMHNLEWFLDTYPDIKFYVHGADKTKVKGKTGAHLSPINCWKILHKFRDRIRPN